MNIFLIRHGESIQNTKENYLKKVPDHLVSLTKKGLQEAEETGLFLKKYLQEHNYSTSNATLWVSPYKRTRQTAEIINKYLNIPDVKEDITLIEERYGLFSDTPIDECQKKYPDQFELYDKYYQNDGKFYAKLPQGESPYDVALRVKQFIDTIFRDLDEGKENFFIVTHGTVIRTFILDWFHYPPEWFNQEPNMENCSIRLIERNSNTSYEHYIKGGPKK